MNNCIMTKFELYKVVSGIRDYLDIDRTHYPLNIFKLCDKISGLKVSKAPFKTRDLRGMLCVAKDSSENNVILINSNRLFVEQNYHCAHEFMHLFGDKPSAGTVLKCYDNIKPNQDPYVEWVANEGAAELLVPYNMIIPSFLSCRNIYLNNYDSWRAIYGNMSVFQALAAEFSVSDMVIIHRIVNLSHEIEQYCTNGGNFDGIEFTSKSYRQKKGITVYDYVGELELKRLYYSFERYQSFNNDLSVGF